MTLDRDAYHTPEAVRREFLPEGTVERRPLLDKPSEPNPILSLLMDQALLRIVLTSDGRTQSLSERVTGSRKTSTPTSHLAADLDELASRFMQAKTHRARILIIKEAQTLAVRLAYAPDRSKVQGTNEWREAIANDPRDNATITVVYGISESTLLRIRKAFGSARNRGGYQPSRLARIGQPS